MRLLLSLYRVAHWSTAGGILDEHPRPLVSATVRHAAGYLAALFRGSFQQSPLHIEGSSQLLPTKPKISFSMSKRVSPFPASFLRWGPCH